MTEHTREDVLKVILELKESKGLEMIGHLCPASLFVTFLESTEHQPEQVWKLLPLLTHMPVTTFLEALLLAPLKIVELLEKPQLNEIVQHHLTSLLHVIEDEHQNFLKQIFNVEHAITHSIPTKVSADYLGDLLEEIGVIRKKSAEYHEVICRALQLAWNTARADLIDKFSNLKEIYFHLYQMIGEWQLLNRSGLFLFIQHELGKVFENDPDSPKFRTLADNDPSFEGLSKLGLYHIVDYWRCGLIPSVKDESTMLQIENSPEREKYVQEMRLSLEKANLRTIKDLKEAYICSPSMLHEYIKIQSQLS